MLGNFVSITPAKLTKMSRQVVVEEGLDLGWFKHIGLNHASSWSGWRGGGVDIRGYDNFCY